MAISTTLLTGCFGPSAKPNVDVHMVRGTVSSECTQIGRYNLESSQRICAKDKDNPANGVVDGKVNMAVIKQAADQLSADDPVRIAALKYVARGQTYPYFEPCRRLMNLAETGGLPKPSNQGKRPSSDEPAISLGGGASVSRPGCARDSRPVSGWVIPRDMPVYGLPDEDWSGPRWLQLADDGGDGRGGVVLLDHGPDPWLYSRTERWISVGTSNDTAPEGPAQLARFALMMLLGSPETPHYSPATDGMATVLWALRSRALPLFEQFANWDDVTWVVDSDPRHAKTTQFTSACIGVTVDGAGYLIVVVASGFDLDKLRLEAKSDMAQYHFDRGHPVTEATAAEARRAAFGGVEIDRGPPTGQPTHPDLTPDEGRS